MSARQLHTTAPRRNALWVAAMMHRISGLALACFLPLHFLTLGLALDSEARLDGALRWMDQPLFRIGETVLVFLLAVHMLWGLRVLVIENMAWRDGQKDLALAALAIAVCVAFAFLVAAV